jgi:hypothetical protein
MRCSSLQFPQPEIAKTVKVLYNLESLPHFDTPYNYGSLRLSIFNRDKKSASFGNIVRKTGNERTRRDFGHDAGLDFSRRFGFSRHGLDSSRLDLSREELELRNGVHCQ